MVNGDWLLVDINGPLIIAVACFMVDNDHLMINDGWFMEDEAVFCWLFEAFSWLGMNVEIIMSKSWFSVVIMWLLIVDTAE